MTFILKLFVGKLAKYTFVALAGSLFFGVVYLSKKAVPEVKYELDKKLHNKTYTECLRGGNNVKYCQDISKPTVSK